MGKLQNITVAWADIELDDYTRQWSDTLNIVHCWETGVNDHGFIDIFVGDECLNLGDPSFVDLDPRVREDMTREDIETWLEILLLEFERVKAFKLGKIKYHPDWEPKSSKQS